MSNCLCLLFLLASVGFASCGRLAITNTNVFDHVTGQMLPGRTVVIKKERITAVGTSEKPVKTGGAKKIDGSGRFIIPGLIDAHTHLIFYLDSVNLSGQDVLPLYLGTGVTSVRNIGDEVQRQQLLRDYAKERPGICPTIFMCSPLLDGRYPYHGADPVSRPLTDPKEVAPYIDSLAKAGVHTLKLYVYMDSSVYRKVIEEGHKHGLTVSAHLPSNYVATKAALDWGIDVVEHAFGGPEDPALIAQMVRQGTMFDPTLIVFQNMMLMHDLPEVYENKDLRFVPDTLVQFWHQYRKHTGLPPEKRAERKLQMEKYKKITRDIYAAGVPIMAGTDVAMPYCVPGFAMHDELLLLVQTGLTPADAIKSATINNAKALREEKNLGTVEAGKIADLVILDANPLSDIRNTRSIYRVIHRGVVTNPAHVLQQVKGVNKK